MIYVCLALAAVALTTVTLMRNLVREHARERQLLLNQLLHAVDKPWLPAPADEPLTVIREPEAFVPPGRFQHV